MANSTPPPVPTREPVTGSDNRATRPWIAWFTTLGKLYGYYQTIFASGAAVGQETGLNFLSPFIVTDNAANGTTDISLPAATQTVQCGKAQLNPTGSPFGAVDVVFTTPFTSVPVVVTSPDNFPRAGNEPLMCYPTRITEAGFTANFSCAVPTGGGGATITNVVNANWIAIVNA